MLRFINCVIFIVLLNANALASTPQNEDDNGYIQAEQFVHGHLYDGMLQVWAVDRRSWNQLLNVHACGGEQLKEKLESSYQAGQSLFSQAMLNYADGQPEFADPQKRAVLSDVAQLAYRLFSASYAHGYARHVEQMNELDDGIHQQLCGVERKVTSPSMVEYSKDLTWQLSSTQAAKNTQLTKAKGIVELHAKHGYRSFNTLLQQQYAQFDALVYSHAYQNPQAYDVLFFKVNGYSNVVSYQAGVDSLGGIQIAEQEDVDIPHADFAYLVLASGYHWGTLSVLAMLEEEFPGLHTKAKDKANKHILKVTKKLEMATDSDDLG